MFNVIIKNAFRYAGLCILTIMMTAPFSFAQKKTVTGTVLDVKNEPVIGAGVQVKGTQIGTVADFEGKYTLSVEDGATLVFTSIGFETKEVLVAGRSVVDVVLSEDSKLLDEVVVIGYGSARRADLTSSISSVKGDLVSSRGTSQVSSALQGQIAGVQVTRGSGDASKSATIRVRGVTTLSNNDPLVIVDGVPGSLDYIDSEDIESISVLKDASAASIYGARAAAGVVLVTTKRAKADQFSLDYRYEYAFDRPTARFENTEVVDFLNVFNEVRMNDGAKEYSVYAKDFIESYMENNAKDPIHYPNTNWMDLILKKSTSHQKHSLSVAAGSNRTKTVATFNYYTGDGYYQGKSYDKYSGRINNDLQITDWMKASVDLNYHYTSALKNAKDEDVRKFAFYLPGIYAPKWANGDYTDVKDGNNILPVLEVGGTNTINNYGLQANAKLEINPFKGFTVSASFSPDFNFSREKLFNKAVQVYYEDGKLGNSLISNTTNLTETRRFSEAYTYQALANYLNTFGDHSINAMLGYEGYTYYYENVDATRKNYVLTNFPYLDLGPEDSQFNSGSASHNAYQSAFGRVIYSFKDRYLFQASVRADGSSRFAKAYRWGVFPSVSLGWVLSSEPWFKTNDYVNYVKLRAAIGSLGNERLGSDFPYQALMEYGTSYIFNLKDVEAVQTAYQRKYAYEDLTWETTTTYGAGVDASFFNSRLSLSLDGYYKKTKNMLLEVGFPSYYGYDSPKANAGDMHTFGYDIEIGWKDRIGDFRYSVSANLSDYRSIMGYLGDKKTVSGNYLREEGSYYNEWYVYKTDGLVLTDEDVALPNLGVTTNMKGLVKVVNTDENETIINADDKVRCGNSLPEYLFGGNVSMGYKNFDFSLQFQGIGHQTKLFNPLWIQPIGEQYRAVPKNLMGNYWSSYNTDEQNAKAKYPMVTWTYRTNTYAASDFWLFNGGYFRVKNITLGYTLPKKVTDAMKMKGLRVYCNVIDLPAISNCPKGVDPEWDMYEDFLSTSVVLGVNVKF